MGFFSSIVRFVKNVFSAVLGVIARFMNSIFGSPIIAALVLFLVTWWICGPMAFSMMWENPLVYALSSTKGYFFTMMFANLVTQVVSAVCPQLGKALGFVVGIVSLCLGGMNIYDFITNGTWNGGVTFFTLTADLGMEMAPEIALKAFSWMSTFSIVTLGTSLAAGTDENGQFNSEFARGYVDGVFAPVEFVAEVVDGGISAATDSLFNVLLWCGLGYVGYKYLSSAGERRDARIAEKRAMLEERQLDERLVTRNG